MPDIDSNNLSLETKDWHSSMECIRAYQDEEGNVTLVFIDDRSNGYRTYSLSAKDFENFKHLLDSVNPKGV